MTKEYLNFILNSFAKGSKTLDKFYHENEIEIEKGASMMHKLHPIKPTKIFRGIVLDEEAKEVAPLKKIPYMSFSLNKEIARKFADLRTELCFAFFMVMSHPKGYIIEHTPDLTEILFHPEWLNLIKIENYLDIDLCKMIIEQEEVIIKQTLKTFQLIKFEEYDKS